MRKKMPKQPKAKKLPKKPKASASLSTWERYESKCYEVTKQNSQALSDWKKATAKIAADEKKRQALINKHKR